MSDDGYKIPPPTEGGSVKKVATAFLVYVEESGKAVATNDIDLVVDMQRECSPSDIYQACAEVMKDITLTEQAQVSLVMQMQMAQQISEQQRTQKMAAALQKKGIVVPKR